MRVWALIVFESQLVVTVLDVVLEPVIHSDEFTACATAIAFLNAPCLDLHLAAKCKAEMASAWLVLSPSSLSFVTTSDSATATEWFHVCAS